MDVSIIIAILGILLLMSVCINIYAVYAWNKKRKRERNSLERIDREGTFVYATVTQVIHQKEKRNYIVFARWQSPETGKVYKFQETYRFLRGTLGFRPKINRGEAVPVNVIFNEPMYRIKHK
jgi:hypothetical protein